MKGFGLRRPRKVMVMISLSFRNYLSCLACYQTKSIYLTSFIYIAALSEASEKLIVKTTVRVALVQEVGRHNDQRMKSSRFSRHYFSTYLWSIPYVQADLAKFKGLLIKIKVIKGFSTKLKF